MPFDKDSLRDWFPNLVEKQDGLPPLEDVKQEEPKVNVVVGNKRPLEEEGEESDEEEKGEKVKEPEVKEESDEDGEEEAIRQDDVELISFKGIGRRRAKCRRGSYINLWVFKPFHESKKPISLDDMNDADIWSKLCVLGKTNKGLWPFRVCDIVDPNGDDMLEHFLYLLFKMPDFGTIDFTQMEDQAQAFLVYAVLNLAKKSKADSLALLNEAKLKRAPKSFIIESYKYWYRVFPPKKKQKTTQ